MSDLHMSELDVFLRAGYENCDKMKYPRNYWNDMKMRQFYAAAPKISM